MIGIAEGRTRTRPMNILYVSQYFPPEMGAPAARVHELARCWVAAGHVVTVLTGFPNHPTGIVPQEYRGRLRRLRCREEIDGIEVVRAWLLPFPNRKAYERMLNYGSFCVSAAVAGMGLRRPDVVIASSPQLLVGLSGYWLAKWKRVPLVFEVRDLWPESLAAVGMGSTNSLLYRGLGKIAGFLYGKAKRIVAVSPAFEERLRKDWNVPREKISVVENGVETQMFRPREKSTLRAELGMENKFVVSYIGTMGMAHGLGTILDAAAQLQGTNPEIEFLMVGEGAEKDVLMAGAKERTLANIKFAGQQGREKVPEYISASDVCLVPLKKMELFKTVIPSKMLEFMACARPLILGVEGQAREIVEEAQCGIAIEPENAKSLADAIRYLASNQSEGREMGWKGREYVIKNFSRQRTAEKYLGVLQEILELPQAQTAAAAA